jgi:hypothetical protein
MSSIIVFIVGIIVSTIIIYFVTKLFGEKGDIKTAFFAAIIGSIVFTVVYAVLGRSLIPGAIGAIAWLLALKWLYSMGWLKVIVVAVIIWIVASIVGSVVPTGMGPL